jgi:hypothetical protein
MLLYLKKQSIYIVFFITCSSLWFSGYFGSVRDIYCLSLQNKRDPEEEGTKLLRKFSNYPVYYMDP